MDRIITPTFILIALLVITAISITAAIAIPCKQVTGTWNIRAFIKDKLYWALAVLNYRYRKSVEDKEPTEEFIVNMKKQIDLPPKKHKRSRWKELNDEQNETINYILETPKFIRINFGTKKYSETKHKQIISSI